MGNVKSALSALSQQFQWLSLQASEGVSENLAFVFCAIGIRSLQEKGRREEEKEMWLILCIG